MRFSFPRSFECVLTLNPVAYTAFLSAAEVVAEAAENSSASAHMARL